MARTDNLSNFLTDVGKAIKTKKNDETPIPAKDFDKEIESLVTGGVAPMNVKNIVVSSGNGVLKLTWTDPEDTYDDDGTLLATWKGTKVVYKEGSYPTSPKDGTVAVDSISRNDYKTTPLEIKNLTNNTTYYIALYPYSDKGLYNENEANRVTGTPIPPKVAFATATDDEVKTIIEAHYKGLINITDYWNVGDTRKIHINATNSGSKAHVAQDMTMVIMDFNHDDLTTSINGKTKAAVSVGFREIMGNDGTSEDEYYWGSSHYQVNDNENYSANPLRTWLNGGLLNALPNTFSSIIKEVNKKNLQYHTKTDGAPLITKDKIWLLSYPEIFGTQSYSYYKGNPTVEGEQYQYFATSSNIIKYPNKNGEKGSAYYYWLRSPSSIHNSSNGYYWCYVNSAGSVDKTGGGYVRGLAPAFCL